MITVGLIFVLKTGTILELNLQLDEPFLKHCAGDWAELGNIKFSSGWYMQFTLGGTLSH